MNQYKKIREWLGVLLLDLPRYLRALKREDSAWLSICNRTERLLPAPLGSGYQCDWKWSSDLHAPSVAPFLGRMLMTRAFEEYPLNLADEPSRTLTSSGMPDISFIIGHRGMGRLPQLRLTLQSIAAQEGVPFECLVVEQSPAPEIQPYLPAWVRYLHDPSANAPYNRARTFNVGHAHARGSLLVLHDNDMAVPAAYTKNLWDKFSRGYEVVNLKRFMFYLDHKTTERVFVEDRLPPGITPECILQNSRAGGSVAIGKSAYAEIGGMDEEFVGWGGEDIEFWERAATLMAWDYTYLPFIHFWHAPQPGKTPTKDTPAMNRYGQLTKISVEDRIGNLRGRLLSHIPCIDQAEL
jgi:hypothetical protein